MNMLYGSKRETYRQIFVEVWQRYQRQEALDAMEKRMVSVILAHPEYHPLLEDPDLALSADFSPESGRSNPFAHMGLHIALLELLAADQPPGMVQLFERLRSRYDQEVAEHRVVECLGALLWQAQREGRSPDLKGLLPCLRRSLGWDPEGEGN